MNIGKEVFKGISKIFIDTRYPRSDRVSVKCTSPEHAEALRTYLAEQSVAADAPTEITTLRTPESEARDAAHSRENGL
jgi:hypothetical protein